MGYLASSEGTLPWYTFNSNSWGDSFAGADIVASVTVPFWTADPANGVVRASSRPIVFGTLETISVSTERQTIPVFACGTAGAKGFARGPRYVAGSLIFVILDREALAEVQRAVREFAQTAHFAYNAYYGNAVVRDLIPNLKSDELPPFDITVTMMNEYGVAAVAKILGVQIVHEGMVMGVNEWYLENEMRYIAQDIQPIYPATVGSVSNPPPQLA